MSILHYKYVCCFSRGIHCCVRFEMLSSPMMCNVNQVISCRWCVPRDKTAHAHHFFGLSIVRRNPFVFHPWRDYISFFSNPLARRTHIGVFECKKLIKIQRPRYEIDRGGKVYLIFVFKFSRGGSFSPLRFDVSGSGWIQSVRQIHFRTTMVCMYSSAFRCSCVVALIDIVLFGIRAGDL